MTYRVTAIDVRASTTRIPLCSMLLPLQFHSKLPPRNQNVHGETNAAELTFLNDHTLY
jgi:hypothetical protein